LSSTATGRRACFPPSSPPSTPCLPVPPAGPTKPKLPSSAWLIQRFHETGAPIVTPTHQGRRGHPTVFAATLFDEIRAAPLDVGARHVVYQHEDQILEVPTDEEGILLNTNDRAAYEKILKIAPPG
jgi:hypothetical protein